MTRYSATWFDTFLAVPGRQTRRELAFLSRQLPLPAFRRILDLCCGAGRHSNGLAEMGYSVTGIDSNAHTLAGPMAGTTSAARFIEADMRALPVAGPFDAALVMWQSFGSFDEATNRSVLERLCRLLRPSGRLVLDIYHRGFFEAHQGERETERQGRSIRERKWMEGDRLHVQLQYPGLDVTDAFDWRIYTPDQIMSEAEDVGLDPICCCANFDEGTAASSSVPRMQLVLSRR